MGLPNPKQYNECTRIYKDNDCTSYVELVADIEVRRSKIRLILITSCAIAILAVFFQLSVSLLVFFSDLKVSNPSTFILDINIKAMKCDWHSDFLHCFNFI